ncbi:MAG: glycoside hydrolase family 16 protein [Oscillospiraceae bacterium]|nr:glycoside hydrolase family 16 protein [Oscillospiraceae bacterium]
MAFIVSAWRTVLTWLLIAVNWFMGLFAYPVYIPALYKGLDYSKFELTWSDEFNSMEWDTEKWGDPNRRIASERQGGYWDSTAVTFDGTAAHIRTEYREADAQGHPAGWYSGILEANTTFRQQYGYFEARLIPAKGVGLWSAFWMFAGSVIYVGDAGNDGTEIDIIETFNFNYNTAFGSKFRRESFQSALHYDGYGSGTHQALAGPRTHAYNLYDEYHTFGVEWNPEEYVFYIDGREYWRTDFGEVSDVPEYVVLSTEVAKDLEINENPAETPPTDFIIDYVRIYQYKDLPETPV